MRNPEAVKQYYQSFASAVTAAQLERVAAKHRLFGSLSVWASCEVVDRLLWGESTEVMKLAENGLVAGAGESK